MGIRTGDTKEVTTNKDALSFGRYLRAIRFEKGISLEEVSWETKIGADILLLIEKEAHEKLPAKVYVKGFLRAYAKAIGADGDKTVKNYIESLDIFQKTTKSEADLKKSDKAFWPRLLLSLGALACVMAISVFSMSILQDRSPMNDSSIQQRSQEIPIEPAPESSPPIEALESVKQPNKPRDDNTVQTMRSQNSEKENYEPVRERFFLKIRTLEETWVKVIVDNQDPKEYTLRIGDLLELEASSGYNLLIGNAGGIKLMLNDKPVEVQGRRGEVVNIQIPQ